MNSSVYFDPTKWENFTEDNVPAFSLRGQKHLAKITSVYDGDTLKACFPFGDKMFIWNCRLAGVDTPELRTRNTEEKKFGYQVRDELRKLIDKKVVIVYCDEFDKYGRLLVRLELQDGTDVSQWLIEQGYAFEYDGGTKKSWEEELKNNPRP